jgi:hypothetical protein
MISSLLGGYRSPQNIGADPPRRELEDDDMDVVIEKERKKLEKIQVCIDKSKTRPTIFD